LGGNFNIIYLTRGVRSQYGKAKSKNMVFNHQKKEGNNREYTTVQKS